MTLQNDFDVSVTDEKEKQEKLGKLDKFLKSGEVFTVMQVVLGQYILLEQYFMAESVQKVRLVIVQWKILQTNTNILFSFLGRGNGYTC